MKKALFILLAFCLLLAVGVIELLGHWKQTTITLYSQEDVISQRVLDSFTKETGIQVQYFLLDDPQAAENPGGYDLLLADVEHLQALLEDAQLAPLEQDAREPLSSVDAAYRSLPFDPENAYTVPYLWTTMGLLYNPAGTDVRVTGWSNLFDGQLSGALVMPSDSQTAFAAALSALGMDVNLQSSQELAAAASYLTQQQPQVAAYCSSGELAAYVSSVQTVLAPCYAGTAIEIMANLPELSFVFPSEGSWRSLLSFALPAAAQKEEAAYLLLDYLCRWENEAKNAAYSGYSVVSPEAFRLLDSSWQTNPLAYPDGEKVASFPILQGDRAELRAQRQVQWQLIQESVGQETTPQFQETLPPGQKEED